MFKYLPYTGGSLIFYDMMPIFLTRQLPERQQQALQTHLPAMVASSLAVSPSNKLMHVTMDQFSSLVLESGIPATHLDPLVEKEGDVEKLREVMRKVHHVTRKSRSSLGSSDSRPEEDLALKGQPVHVGVAGSELCAKMLYGHKDWAGSKAIKDPLVHELVKAKCRVTAVVRGSLTCKFDGETIKAERTADECVRLVGLGCSELMLEDGTGKLTGRQLENTLKTLAACAVPPGDVSLILRADDVSRAASCFRQALNVGVSKFGIVSGSFTTSNIIDSAVDSPSADQVDFGDGVLCGTELQRWVIGLRAHHQHHTSTRLFDKPLLPEGDQAVLQRRDSEDLNMNAEYQRFAESVQKFVE